MLFAHETFSLLLHDTFRAQFSVFVPSNVTAWGLNGLWGGLSISCSLPNGESKFVVHSFIGGNTSDYAICVSTPLVLLIPCMLVWNVECMHACHENYFDISAATYEFMWINECGPVFYVLVVRFLLQITDKWNLACFVGRQNEIAWGFKRSTSKYLLQQNITAYYCLKMSVIFNFVDLRSSCFTKCMFVLLNASRLPFLLYIIYIICDYITCAAGCM